MPDVPAAAQRRPQLDTPPAPLAASPFEDLFRDHHERVYRAAYRITGDAMDAEDVLQSVFLRLLHRPDVVVASATARSYLHRAAVNAALDLLRGRKRSREVELGESAERLSDAGDADPEGRRRNRELRRALRGGLARLAPESAEVFALRYFEGLGNRDIADLLDLAPTTVAVRLHRARRRLQKELAAHRGDPS